MCRRSCGRISAPITTGCSSISGIASRSRILIPIWQAPADPAGHPHPIGVFECEGTSDYFKTLGAKKYCGIKGSIYLTVSGVNKKSGAAAIKSLDDFELGKVFNYEQAGRLIAYYVDDQKPCISPTIRAIP